VNDLCDATPSRANFLTAVAFSKNKCETNPSREQKNAAVFANRSSWRKVTISSLIDVRHNKCTSGKKNRYSECYKVLYAGPKSARTFLTNLSPNLARLTTLPALLGAPWSFVLNLFFIICKGGYYNLGARSKLSERRPKVLHKLHRKFIL